jgi:hypothetical protein
MKRGRADAILDEVRAAVQHWPEFAHAAKLPEKVATQIQQAHRLSFPEE